MTGVDECAGAVADVARTCARTTSATSADMIYLRSVSMVQAWSRAGLRVMRSPLTPVTSTVSPFRARSASSSCSACGSVSSARGLLRCGSHVMSSMLMVVSFPATFVASNRGVWIIDPVAGCGGVAVPVVSLPVPCVFSCPTTCTRRAGRDAFPATFVTLCGLGACHGPRMRRGVSGCGLLAVGFDGSGLEPCRVEGEFLTLGASGEFLSRHVHGEHSGDSASQVPIVFVAAGGGIGCNSLPMLLRPSRVRRLVLVGRGWGRVSCHGRMVCAFRVVRGPHGACGRVRGGFVLVC
ncbi:hypothetical protein BCUN_0979 [Bifidobacterium cuniculi]|uniref:Uncharacterized protein n=1 Tax=Bifidobacterium cuniculi TaxID=1688 RepID=A0A087AQF2_9BIFI|nr:hypothetical protein BCUN_0979 [Bifidobacterium cuniculi]